LLAFGIDDDSSRGALERMPHGDSLAVIAGEDTVRGVMDSAVGIIGCEREDTLCCLLDGRGLRLSHQRQNQ